VGDRTLVASVAKSDTATLSARNGREVHYHGTPVLGQQFRGRTPAEGLGNPAVFD
jgi:hypothetical protein